MRLWQRAAELLLIGLLTATPAEAESPSGNFVRRLNVDADAELEVVVENSFYRMVIDPAMGASAASFIVKPAEVEMLLPDSKHGAGLLADVIREQGFGGELQNPYQVRIEETDPGITRVIFQRQGATDSPYQHVSITRTLTLRVDSPVIDVRVEILLNDSGPRQFALRYGVHNRVADPQFAMNYFLPSLKGVDAYALASESAGSRQHHVKDPPRNWLAAAIPDGPGLGIALGGESPELLYAYTKGSIATLEWGYPQQILRKTQPYVIEYRVVPFMGLPRVDGVVDNRVGTILFDDIVANKPVGGQVMLAGEAGACRVAIDWRRVPELSWNSLPEVEMNIEPRQSASAPFQLPQIQAGTIVIRARLLDGDTTIGAFERNIVVGESSGRYAMLPKIVNHDQLGRTTREGAISLTPQTPISVKKILPIDARLVRGFAHAPVDGRTDTRHAQGGIGELTRRSGVPAISYGDFNDNQGFHLILSDPKFNAVQIRGGWRGCVYADTESLDQPAATAPPLLDVQSQFGTYRKTWAIQVNAKKLSFFHDENENEPLSDVTVLAISAVTAPNGGDDATFGIGEPMDPGDDIHQIIESRWGPAYEAHRLAAGAGKSISLDKGQFIHLLSEPQEPAFGIGAITFELHITAIEPGALLTLRVHDVLDPRRESMGVDFSVTGPGVYKVTLDTPDQIFLPSPDQWRAPPRLDGPLAPPPVLWISIASDAAMRLEGASVMLHRVTREEALVEAGAWRKFLLKGLFSTMSEPRPWMNLTDKKPVREQISSSSAMKVYESSLLELLQNVEMARLLLPDDDIVRQYHEWLYQNMDKRKPQPEPKLPEEPGAPRWAVMVRESWREMSLIANWWLENRLVADGEFGGSINDDTDLFQTWQCLPMIESEPLGAKLKDAAARLADTASRVALEEGINIRTMDSLHAYEEGVNQLALCAWWFYGDPVHYERAMISARSVMKLMVNLPDGRVHFGGGDVGIDQMHHGFEKYGATPGDGNWAPIRLLLQPMYVTALYNRSPAIIERFKQWGQTWLDYQKPGQFVGKVDIKTGAPINPTTQPTPWSIGPIEEWLELYQLTGDPKWNEPLKQAIDSGGYWGAHVRYGRSEHALVTWPEPYQQKMRAAFNSGYAGFFLTKDRAPLERPLADSVAWFSRFRHMNTAAEQRTDRVLNYDATTPISCYLGDAPNRNRWLNFTAVSYEGLRGEDFAGLVWDAGPSELRVAIFNFNEKPITGLLRVRRLDHGQYRVRLGPDADDDGVMDTAKEEYTAPLQRYASITLNLPPRQVTIVNVEQLEQLDDILDRADLAISTIDAIAAADGLVVKVHNIGAKTASNIVVTHSREGHVLAAQTIAQIEAPFDLHPRSVEVLFTATRAGDIIDIDPDGRIPEIAEHNNHLAIR